MTDSKATTSTPDRPAEDPFAVYEPAIRPYWDSALRDQLLIQRCNACGEHYHYPRPFCPFCASRDVEWQESAAEGVIYSYTVVTVGKTTPVTIGLVTLDEGPTVQTRIVDGDGMPPKIGDRVKGRFEPGPKGVPLLVFALA